MKSPEKTTFEVFLAVVAVLALALLPLAAEAGCGMKHQPPAFSEIDADGDGFVSEEEFNAFRAERHAKMADEGRPMKGMATAPAFADVDTDGDGKLSEAELTAAQQAHMQAMHQEQGGKGMGHGQHHGGMKMPTFSDLDLNGDGCIDADEFAEHQAEMHPAG